MTENSDGVPTLGDIYDALVPLMRRGVTKESVQWVVAHQFPETPTPENWENMTGPALVPAEVPDGDTLPEYMIRLDDGTWLHPDPGTKSTFTIPADGRIVRTEMRDADGNLITSRPVNEVFSVPGSYTINTPNG